MGRCDGWGAPKRPNNCSFPLTFPSICRSFFQIFPPKTPHTISRLRASHYHIKPPSTLEAPQIYAQKIDCGSVVLAFYLVNLFILSGEKFRTEKWQEKKLRMEETTCKLTVLCLNLNEDMLSPMDSTRITSKFTTVIAPAVRICCW